MVSARNWIVLSQSTLSLAPVSVCFRGNFLEEIELLHNQPLQIHRQFGDLTVGISHHLPDKNWGESWFILEHRRILTAWWPILPCDIAVYGHIHQQLLRYGTGGQLIVNPGSIGQPFFLDAPVAEGLAGPVYDFGVWWQGLGRYGLPTGGLRCGSWIGAG